MNVLADTNILLRRLQRGHAQYSTARDAIKTFSSSGNRICVTSQNLVELWAVCTRPVEYNGFGLTPTQANRVVARVEISVFRLPDSDAVYAEWRKIVINQMVCGKKTHDARIVAAMLVHGVSHILTFNYRDFERYPGITVIDPTNC